LLLSRTTDEKKMMKNISNVKRIGDSGTGLTHQTSLTYVPDLPDFNPFPKRDILTALLADSSPQHGTFTSLY
jgi:hypothetical protein